MAEVANLKSDTNFSKSSGIIYQIEDGASLEGRPKSKVYVFTKVGKNLKYILDEGNKISFIKSLSDKLHKASYSGISVSLLTKFLRFTTDFSFGDLKVADVMVETRLKAKEPDDIGISFIEEGDPVKDICFMIKAHLSRVFTEINLENLDNLQQFTDNVYHRVEEMKITHPFLNLEGVSVQYKLPPDIEKAFEDIQKERIELKKIEARSAREYEEVQQAQKIEQLKGEADLKLKELQLERLGIDDIKIRLLMTDPEKRAQYLDEIYNFQMDLLKERREQASELLKMKREIIRKHFEAASTDMTDYKELEKILKLLDQSAANISAESVLGTMMPEEKLLDAKFKTDEQKPKKRKSSQKQENREN